MTVFYFAHTEAVLIHYVNKIGPSGPSIRVARSVIVDSERFVAPKVRIELTYSPALALS